MAQNIQVYSLAWDNEDGCGCEVYATQQERDAALRGALISYLGEHNLLARDMTLNQLVKLLAEHDYTRGARYTSAVHNVAI